MKLKNVLKQLVIVLTSCILIGCATQGNEANPVQIDEDRVRPDCIFRSSVRGYRVLDESNLIVEAAGNRNYHVVLRNRARGLRSTWSIEFETVTGSICARTSTLVTKGSWHAQSNQISHIRELSDEDLEDLLIRFGKKEPEVEHTPATREIGGADVEELDTAADNLSGN